MLDLDSLHKQAIALHAQGQLAEAERKYREILQQAPDRAEVWSDLGALYDKMGHYQRAVEMISKCLEIAPPKAIHLCRLGMTFNNMGETARAIDSYERAIALDPHWTDAYVHLSHLLFNAGNLSKAESICRKGLLANIENASIYQILGLILVKKRQFDESIAAHSKALSLLPNNPILLRDLGIAYQEKANEDRMKASFYLGCAAYREKNFQEAIVHLQNFLNFTNLSLVTDESIIKGYLNLAECFQNIDRYDEAIQTYQNCLQRYPNYSEIYCYLIGLLSKIGKTKEAIAVATHAARLFPQNSILQASQYLVPILYENPQEIEGYRRRFLQGLEELIQNTSLETREALQEALKWIGIQNNFYLHYQGYNDVGLQTRFGKFVHQCLAAHYPAWTQPLPMPSLNEGGKIRIGYISPCMWNHTVAKLFVGWLRNHNRDRFEIYSYSLSEKFDSYSFQFQTYSDSFHQFSLRESEETTIESIAPRILGDRLHVLVYLDIGMHSFIPLLAGLRLAPVQCLSWGHPVTSGLPTIDYFLSSQLMEPENASAHYSERLVLLPNIGISYAKPAIPELTKKRADFQLREDAVVYLSCQSLFKYLPQYDYIFAAIAQQVPQAQFAFISRLNKLLTDKFWHRLQRAFDGVGLKAEDYCVILPDQDLVSYWNLNAVSDIFLDTISWSGGNTTLEAIACDLPIVTCPGTLMRGRHSYAILKMLGVTETIAKTEAEYIEIAVQLGLNSAWRDRIVQQMKQHHSHLYDDKVSVSALETFYQHVVTRAMGSGKV